MADQFGYLLEAEIPKLRRYARALTGDAVRTDDLVQSCLLRALEKSHLWQPGTDLRAWLCTILHNQHVNGVRRAVYRGTTVPVEHAEPAMAVPARQGASMLLRDLDRALARLPEEQRILVLLIGLEGMPYDHVALLLGIPTGTVRSRLSRARDLLRRFMDMETRVQGDVARTAAPLAASGSSDAGGRSAAG